MSRNRSELRLASPEAAGVLLIRISIYCFMGLALTRTWVDPDVWGHVRFGADIVANGLTSADPYSFASDVPWTNHEWLAEVLFYVAYAATGAAGLIALKALLIAPAALLVIRTVRNASAPALTGDFLVFGALAGMWPRTYVLRPQIFSVVLFVVLLWLVRSAETGHAKRLFAMPLVFAAWVNLHGGWIVGSGVFGLWIAATVVQRRQDARIPARLLLITGLLTLAATLANPYGVQLWTFLATTVRPDRPNIDDWRPLFESGIGFIVPWAICATLAIIAFTKRRPPIPWSHALIVIGLGLGSIRVSRLDVFFSVSVIMLLAPQIAAGSRPTRAIARAWTAAAVAGAVAVAAAWVLVFFVIRQQFTCVLLDVPWMPEREAAVFIKSNHLQGRLLTWFNWGQYAIWHFSPQLQVSLDGRRETVYSDAYVRDHLRLYYDPDAERSLLERLNPDYAWLPASLPLVGELDRLGWQRVYSGPVSVVFSRSTRAFTAPPPVQGPACFPGP